MTNETGKEMAAPASGELVAGDQGPGDNARLISVIERAALDPDYDVDKLERLLAAKRQWDSDEARKAFHQAMAAFQAECPPIPKTGKASVNTRSGGEYQYAFPKFEVMQAICKPVLTKHGLHAKFGEYEVLPNGWIQIHCIVAHHLGHSEKTAVAIPVPDNVPVNAAQKAGIALSYAKRYSYAAALGLIIQGVDHDAGLPPGYGDPAGGKAITDEQCVQIAEYLESTGSDESKFCAFFGVGKVSEIPASKFDDAIQMLRDKERGEGRFKGK